MALLGLENPLALNSNGGGNHSETATSKDGSLFAPAHHFDSPIRTAGPLARRAGRGRPSRDDSTSQCAAGNAVWLPAARHRGAAFGDAVARTPARRPRRP